MSDPVAPADSPGPALRDYGTAELGVAIQALEARGGRIHEGVHQARKSMRRTRALLALGDVLGPGAKLIDRELRRLVRGLSTLRDAHALVETLDRLLDRPCDKDTKLRLARARRAAAHARAGLTKGADVAGNLADTRALLLTLRAALPGLPWDQIARSMLEAALAATSHDIDSARERVRTHGRDEDWHRWRRRMRRLSQQHRACAAAGVEITVSMFDKSLAEQLGVMQDLTLLLEHCGSGSPFSKQDAEALRRFAQTALSRQRKRVASVGT
jgi:hypothetical protein